MPVSIVSTMGETPLIVSNEDGMVFLTLNRPKQYNAFSRALLDALYKTLGGDAENKKLAVSGVNRGLFCSTLAVTLTRTISRKRAAEMLMTGEFINAATALNWGLFNRVMAADALRNTTLRFCETPQTKTQQRTRHQQGTCRLKACARHRHRVRRRIRNHRLQFCRRQCARRCGRIFGETKTGLGLMLKSLPRG